MLLKYFINIMKRSQGIHPHLIWSSTLPMDSLCLAAPVFVNPNTLVLCPVSWFL